MRFIVYIILVSAGFFISSYSLASGGGTPNGTSLNCGDTDSFSLGNNGFVGSNPTSAAGSCGQCCYSGSDLDGDGDQDVSFSIENTVWYQYCNSTGSPITIDFVVDEVNNNCNVQGAIFVGPTGGTDVIDCSNSQFSEYGSNPGGNGDGFSFTATIPDGECAFIMIDGYGGATCSALTISAICPCTPPTITASASPTTICSGESVTLSASGAGAGGSYSWDNGAGNGSSVTVSPNSTTTYEVTGTTSDGCTGVQSVTVTVNPPPTADAGGDQSICEGGTVTIGADPVTNTDDVPYSCDNGGGSGTINIV